MSRGIFKALTKLKDMVEAIDPKTDIHQGFVCINDGSGLVSPLNTRFQRKLKNGDIGYYLNGMKLEGSNISVFGNRDSAYQLLTEVGGLEIVDLQNEIYKVNIESKYIGTWGANEKLYVALQKTPEGKKAQFRTYDWDQVRKSAVFYEPIKLPVKKVMVLAEQQGIK